RARRSTPREKGLIAQPARASPTSGRVAIISGSSPEAISGSSPMVTNSEEPIPNPPSARANRAKRRRTGVRATPAWARTSFTAVTGHLPGRTTTRKGHRRGSMHPRSVPGRQPMAAPGTRARGTVAKTAGIWLTSHARSRIGPGPRPAGALGVAPGGSGAGAEDRRADTHDGRALLDSD